MKTLVKKILILLILLAFFDFTIGLLLNKFLINSPDGRYYKANYSLNKSNEEVIIFGSSRAETNFAPFIIEDSLKLSCWNTGRGGQTLPFWYAMEKGVINRYTPKISIINVEEDFLSTDLNDESYERAGFLRPFYNTNPEIRPIINRISKFEKFLLYSKIYAYNSSFYYLLRPYLIKDLDGKIADNGWKAMEGTVPKSAISIKTVQTINVLNEETVELFNIFISNFVKNGSKVYIVISPNYGYSVGSTPTIKYLMKMDGVNLINFGNDSCFFENHLFFYDFEHLNKKGAIEFTKKLTERIIDNNN